MYVVDKCDLCYTVFTPDTTHRATFSVDNFKLKWVLMHF